MHLSKINEWAQVFATLGVLVGILLVLQEMRQNSEIALVEARATRLVSWEEISRLEIQSDIREIFVKSIENPDDLTRDEVLRLDSYFVNVISILQQGEVMYQAGIADEEFMGLGANGLVYFGGRFGRVWFNSNKFWIEATTPRLAEAISEQLQSTPVQVKFEYIEDLMQRLRQIDGSRR